MPESAAGKSYVAAIRSAFCEVRSDKPVKHCPQRRYSLESAACSDEAEPGKCRRPDATCHERPSFQNFKKEVKRSPPAEKNSKD